jgi:AraC-like DNA-binding protein
VQLYSEENAPNSNLIGAIFNCSVYSGQQRNSLTVESSWLQWPVIRTYVDLRSILGLLSLALIPWPSPASIKIRVTQLITKTISRHGRAPSLDEVASLLDRSSSTLRRQLQHEGTSFQALKDAWRLQRAKELLQSEKPLTDIASILGFESNSVFSRAFKSWTGVAPSIFRATLYSSETCS